jgi:hypothetical protein
VARLVTCTENAAVLLEFKSNVALNELSANIRTKHVNNCTGICDIGDLERFGGVLEETGARTMRWSSTNTSVQGTHNVSNSASS